MKPGVAVAALFLVGHRPHGVLHQPGAATHSTAHLDARPHLDAGADPHAHPHVDPIAHAKPDADADPHAHSDAHSCPDANADGHTDADAHPDAHADSTAHRDSTAHAHHGHNNGDGRQPGAEERCQSGDPGGAAAPASSWTWTARGTPQS